MGESHNLPSLDLLALWGSYQQLDFIQREVPRGEKPIHGHTKQMRWSQNSQPGLAESYATCISLMGQAKERDLERRNLWGVSFLLPLHLLSLPSALGAPSSAREPPRLVTSPQVALAPTMLEEPRQNWLSTSVLRPSSNYQAYPSLVAWGGRTGRPEALVLLTGSGKEKRKGEETFFFFFFQ